MTALHHTLVASILICIIWAPVSNSQQPVQSFGDISNTELEQRLQFIETRLDGLKKRKRVKSLFDVYAYFR